MKKKALIIVAVLSISLLATSGCVEALRKAADAATGGECMELEEKAEEQTGLDCKCYPTDIVPEGVSNQTGIEELEGKCYCTCSYEGEEVNVSIVEGKGEEVSVLK